MELSGFSLVRSRCGLVRDWSSRHYSLVFGRRKLLLVLRGVYEFMADLTPWIKPGQYGARLHRVSLSERERSVVEWLGALCSYGADRRVQHRSIGVENVNDVTVSDGCIGQHEPVRSRWQDAPRNLDGLAEGELRGLIVFICSRSRQYDR